MKHLSLGALLITLCFGAAAEAAAPSYAVIDLGVQQAGEGLRWQGLVSTPAPIYYPELRGGVGFTFASNNVAVVGFTCFDERLSDQSGCHATKWGIDAQGDVTTPTDLGQLPNATRIGGPTSAEAHGLNRNGDVVGVSDSMFQCPHAFCGEGSIVHGFLWRNGVMTDLGAIAGNEYNSVANSVNDSHEIVGWTNTISKVTGRSLKRAFVYIGGTMYNLTFYLVGGPTVLLSEAIAIDCQGNIAAVGVPASGGSERSYLLLRQGTPRKCLN
jgi:uncharacterized membrane protein